jgi:hypothetical protein
VIVDRVGAGRRRVCAAVSHGRARRKTWTHAYAVRTSKALMLSSVSSVNRFKSRYW